MAYQGYRWITPRNALEHYIWGKPGVVNIDDGTSQLWTAVVEGSVQAKHKGRKLTLEELLKLRRTRWSDDEEYVLPPDIELSVEDIERYWGEQAGIEERNRSKRRMEALRDRKKFSVSRLRDEYKSYVADCNSNGIMPNREDDVVTMRAKLGDNVPVKSVYAIRATLAPSEWKAKGRRRSPKK